MSDGLRATLQIIWSSLHVRPERETFGLLRAGGPGVTPGRRPFQVVAA